MGSGGWSLHIKYGLILNNLRRFNSFQISLVKSPIKTQQCCAKCTRDILVQGIIKIELYRSGKRCNALFFNRLSLVDLQALGLNHSLKNLFQKIGTFPLIKDGRNTVECKTRDICFTLSFLNRLHHGRSLQLGEGGIAADIRYAFGTPMSCSKRSPMPDAMPQRQHTP
jgi:hypothetical protein